MHAQSYHELTADVREADLYEHVPDEFMWDAPAVPNYSYFDATIVLTAVPRDAIGFSSKVGVLHVGVEQGKGVIGYVAEVDGAQKLVALVGRGIFGLRARRLLRPEEAADVAVVAA